MIDQSDIMVQLKIQEIEKYITHAERQIDQVYRRVVGGETIPHHEKVLKSVCIPGNHVSRQTVLVAEKVLPAFLFVP